MKPQVITKNRLSVQGIPVSFTPFYGVIPRFRGGSPRQHLETSRYPATPRYTVFLENCPSRLAQNKCMEVTHYGGKKKSWPPRRPYRSAVEGGIVTTVRGDICISVEGARPTHIPRSISQSVVFSSFVLAELRSRHRLVARGHESLRKFQMRTVYTSYCASEI